VRERTPTVGHSLLPSLALAVALLAPTAHAGDRCVQHGPAQAHADVAAAVEALPQAEEVAQEPATPSAAELQAHARTVHALQKGGTDDAEERRIVEVVASLEPMERAQLLRLIDQGRDKYDLRHMVYEDVDDPGRRARLLQLMDEAGQALTEAGAHELGIISDIDDTVAPMGAAELFPGAGALYGALERGPDGQGQAGDIHYVTARPPLVLGDARKRLDRAGVPQGTIDDGSLAEAIFRGHDGFEDEKVRDIERQLRLHPGQKFVLIGDDTQRDPEVYRRIAEAHPDRVAGIFIHRVEGGEIDRERYPADRFVFFDSYAQASQVMTQRGLIAQQKPVTASEPATESTP
jgi:hypothetical protein